MNAQATLHYRYGHRYVARRHRGCGGLHTGGFMPVQGLRKVWANMAQIDWE